MFELTVARKHIWSNPRLVLFSILSVSLAVMVIVVMMGLMEGYRGDVIQDTVENNPHIIVDPKQEEKFIYLYRTLTDILKTYPQVVAVSPRLVDKAGAKYKDKVRGVIIIGADPLLEDPLRDVQKDMVWGNYMDLLFKRNSVVVGVKLAEDLELNPEDSFQLVRRNVSVRVVPAGYIRTGTTSDQTLVYLPLRTAQDLLGEGDVVSEVGVRLSDIYAAQEISADVNSRTSYDAKSWQDRSRQILDLLETQKVFMYIFYVLIFIISGLGVANTMVMIVSRRTKEIGILMAMGASRRSIVKIFVTESMILGPPSAAVGCLLAYALAKLIQAYPIEVPSEIYVVSRMTVILIPEFFLYAVIFALLVNLFAGIYPAIKASRLDPVKAIAGI